MKEKPKEEKWKIKAFTLALILILIGTILVLAALYWEKALPESGQFIKTLFSLMQTLGIALFGFGIFNIALDTKGWREYFEERIRHIVIEQSYLKTLSPSILNSLQTNVLKALFKDPDIDRDGSFLNYFHDNLHKYISEPFREDVACEILCTEHEKGYSVFDRITYVCKKAKSSIQPQVSWLPDHDEFISVESVTIEVQFPYNHPQRGQKKVLHNATDLDSSTPDKIKIEVSLEDYKDIDGLTVIVTSKYVVSNERFQYWQMAHPTKNLDITITYPPHHNIQIKPLVINPDLVLITQNPGYVKMKYDSWMLPQSGLAWKFSNSGKRV